MKAKEYLMQYRLLKDHLQDIENEIVELNEEAESIRIKLDDLPRGTDISDRTAKLAVAITDLTIKAIKSRDLVLRKKSEIVSTLRELKDSNQYRVLYKRYVEGKRWEQIAVETGYTYRNVTRIHGRGLASVQSILDKRCPTMSY